MAVSKKKAKKTEVPVPSKKHGKSSGFKWFRRFILLCLILIAGGCLGITFVPEQYIPQKMQPFYDRCLTVRNKAIRRSGLPISRFEDSISLNLKETPEIRLYFAPSPKIDKALCSLIDSAEGTVDVCAYDLRLNNVTDAMIRARNRGVEVRAVTDTDNYHLATIDRLQKAGITVGQDHRPTIMHNKFVIVDAKKIWTGSYNFTVNGTLKNDNNAIVITSPGLAACYTTKFEEYLSGKYGIKAKTRTKDGSLIIGELPIQVAFAPADQVSELILFHLRYAKRSVRIMAFSFTSKPIAEQLTALSKKGVSVQCLFDYGQSKSKYSRDDYLKRRGIGVRLSPNRSGKMHHKVIIIDDETVITGSYNFSSNADRSNDENIMILRNAELAKHYIREFKRCWKGTKGY